VTLEVAGERVQLTVGQQAADVAGLKVSLDSVTQDTVQVRVAR
jgi:tRNA threonylcarbamoyladenosine modification (KEOPS) complex  Pcc1 subunit